MCELYAVTAKRKITVNDTLKTFYSHSEEHKNGWGIYLKDDAYLKVWEAWLCAHPEYPRSHARAIVADVCRPEWLFEIESDATSCP